MKQLDMNKTVAELVAEYPDDSKILAVTHGGPTRGLICAVLGMPREISADELAPEN